MPQIDATVLVTNIVQEAAILRESRGAFVEVVKQLRLSEILLREQRLHDHVHLVLQQAVDRESCEHADCLLDEGSRDAILLRQEAGLDLPEAADAVVHIAIILQHEEDLAHILKMTAVRQGALTDALEKLSGQIVFLVVVDRRVNILDLRPGRVMKANEQHVFDLLDWLLLVLGQHLLGLP